MPNYDYKCQTCGHVFEVFQSMNDSKLEDCPAEGCEGKVKRLLGTGAGLLFKGGGFYETDYRSQSYKDGAKKESEAGKPKTEAKSEAKSESKPGSSSASTPPKSSD